MRRAYSPASARRQRGQSLISMLIGLAISLITIAAMLVLYKTLINVSGNASRAALRDGQVAAALLGAQMDLQSAGFGVPSTDALSTRLAISASGKQVVWRDKAQLADTTYQCSGLLLVDGSGLYALPAKACTDASSVSWAASEERLITGTSAFFAAGSAAPGQPAGTTPASDEVGATTLAGDYQFKLATPHACLPYMQQNFASTPGAVAQQIELTNSSGKALFSLCMPNLAS